MEKGSTLVKENIEGLGEEVESKNAKERRPFAPPS
jgi:hypothetical protein